MTILSELGVDKVLGYTAPPYNEGQCFHDQFNLNGLNAAGHQRYICVTCGYTWADGKRDAPLTIMANLATHFKAGKSRTEAQRDSGYAYATVWRYYTLFERATRKQAPSTHNGAKTHCKHGHEFTEDNTYRPARGGRVCIKCTEVLNRRKYEKRKAALAAARARGNMPALANDLAPAQP